MRIYPQQDHCDLGIVDDDATEDLRTNRPDRFVHSTKNAPGRCANTAEGQSNNPITTKEKF
jgi:hypothetical protein